ncbi:MAG: regulatory iron-sulfur-containing complex subunit RicT [Candidatus Zixiibacteriota bacterium]
MPDIFLVEFKGNRRELFYNKFYHSLKLDEYVIVQAERGEDAGILRRKISEEIKLAGESPRSILRPASDVDKADIEENNSEEEKAWIKAEELIHQHHLEMKLVDIEYQFDRNKLTFFFTADQRVDFRALVRDLASVYKTRIELRQIGVRDEAKRIGGYGVCGQEQCCSSFLKKFEPISTQDARVQGLSLNPSKISGNCGRLLCCLKYEVDFYSEIRGSFPEVGSTYTTDDGPGIIDRINFFDDFFVVKLESGEEKTVTRREIDKKERMQKSGFKQFLGGPANNQPRNGDNSE